MQIKQLSDPSFRRYGRVLEGFSCWEDSGAGRGSDPFRELIQAMDRTPLPEDVVYVPSVKELEALDAAGLMERSLYGGMPVQIGYCNGHNSLLNAVEYHRDSEINVAVTDLVLILGARQDITEDFTYDTSLMEAFLVKAGTVVEVYATTLHYAPCQVNRDGFRCVVALPRGTNTELGPMEPVCREDRLLYARNKWLIAHPESRIPGAHVGLTGENLAV